MAWTLGKLAAHVNGRVMGDDSLVIDSVATLLDGKQGQISFLTNKKYRQFLATTKASAVIVAEEEECPASLLVVDNPHAAYAKVAQLLNPPEEIKSGVHPTATIHESSNIHETAQIGPNVVIEENVTVEAGVRIGANTFVGKNSFIDRDSIIYPLVSLYHDSSVGKRCILHSGVVIGSDGFGHAYDQGSWLKIPQVGRAVIGDDVEIGASTTVDRGAIGDTIIENGVKLDNQIQIAHNVRIGAHSVLASGVGVAGSTKLGKNCMVGGYTGIAGHLDIADNVTITAKSMVIKSIVEPGSYSSGIPAEPSKLWRRYVGRFKRLESLNERVAKCEAILKDKD